MLRCVQCGALSRGLRRRHLVNDVSYCGDQCLVWAEGQSGHDGVSLRAVARGVNSPKFVDDSDDRELQGLFGSCLQQWAGVVLER